MSKEKKYDNPRNRIEANCKHEKIVRFHENAPLYCSNCEKYVEYYIENDKIIVK